MAPQTGTCADVPLEHLLLQMHQVSKTPFVPICEKDGEVGKRRLEGRREMFKWSLSEICFLKVEATIL